jgi:hypothetical protein
VPFLQIETRIVRLKQGGGFVLCDGADVQQIMLITAIMPMPTLKRFASCSRRASSLLQHSRSLSR